MKDSRIKSFFIREGLKSSNPASWENIIITQELVKKETEKAVFLENPKTKENVWVPKRCLIPIQEVSTEVPEAVVLGDVSFSELPKEIEEALKKCKSCGNYTNGKCQMYNNLNAQFSLILCLQNDMEAKDSEIDYANHRISQLEEVLNEAGIEI